MIREDGSVVFEGKEQEELNRIVQDRLAREKEKYADYEDLKGLDEELKAYGYQGTAKERREIIKAQREEYQRQQELEELQKQVKTEGTSPELLALINDLKKEIKDSKAEIAEMKKEKQDKIEAKKQADQQKEHMAAMISEFEETYPDIDLNQLNEDEDFIDFLSSSNPNLSLVKVYERYNKYVHGATNKAVAKIQSNLERSTSSGKSKGANEHHGLSASQRETVDEWNRANPKMKMTYQEFAQSLRK